MDAADLVEQPVADVPDRRVARAPFLLVDRVKDGLEGRVLIRDLSGRNTRGWPKSFAAKATSLPSNLLRFSLSTDRMASSSIFGPLLSRRSSWWSIDSRYFAFASWFATACPLIPRPTILIPAVLKSCRLLKILSSMVLSCPDFIDSTGTS